MLSRLENNFTEIFKSLHQKTFHKMEDKCLYPGQMKLLSLIKANEGIPQKDLSEKNFVKPATLTGMLNKLEANCYVSRVPDGTDKRITRVYLTPEGQVIAKHGEMFLKVLTNQIFEGFTDEELQTMIHLTDKINDNLRNLEK